MKYGWIMSGALVLALTTGAWAQDQQFGGMVEFVDPASRTVHFTTGEIIHLEPGTKIMVDGREVPIEQVTRGMNVELTRDAAAAQQPVTAQPQVQTQVQVQPQIQQRALEGHPAVDASGMVAQVDQQGRVITFQDGRTFRLGPQSDVWQEGQIGQIQPGQRVLVREAQPLAIQGLGERRMGRVRTVDQATAQVTLRDGTIVRLSPGTRYQMGDQTVTITDLQPGDEIVVVVKPANGVAALPREAVAEPRVAAPAPALGERVMGPMAFDAEDVRIYRHRQSP